MVRIDRLPLSRVLVVDDWPDLELRRHELPPRGSALGVLGVPPAWLEQQYHVTRVEKPDGGMRLWEVNPILVRLLESRPFPGTILDLGCGQGRDAVWMAANGWRVIAVDRLPDAIERGQDLQSRYAPDADIQWVVQNIETAQKLPADLLYLAFGPTRLLDPSEVTADEALVVGFSETHHMRMRKPPVADLVTPALAETWLAEYGEMELSDRHVAYFHRLSPTSAPDLTPTRNLPPTGNGPLPLARTHVEVPLERPR